MSPASIDLFVGAGGLAIGTSAAGFHHEVVVELDHDACETIRTNQERKVEPLSSWPLREEDVSRFDFTRYAEKIDLLSGGPPCQPFSLGGKHRGHADHRNLFPEVFRAVREVKPRAILIENVKGLLRESFARYFEYIYLQLSYPEVALRDEQEPWKDHLSRLERHHTQASDEGLFYRVVFRVLNAADYGVPQRRERLIIVGIRGDLGVEWSFPDATHSRERLVWDQCVTGDYWERHEVPKRARPEPSLRAASMAKRLSVPPSGEAWLTVRDALADMPEPKVREHPNFLNHRLIPGARPYPGHTGSPQDEPAKTLKAGVHGVPGGENTLRLASDSVRYFSLREAARLQTFPDDYYFPGSWTESMRQLGNAVPVKLAAVVAAGIRTRLAEEAVVV